MATTSVNVPPVSIAILRPINYCSRVRCFSIYPLCGHCILYRILKKPFRQVPRIYFSRSITGSEYLNCANIVYFSAPSKNLKLVNSSQKSKNKFLEKISKRYLTKIVFDTTITSDKIECKSNAKIQ